MRPIFAIAIAVPVVAAGVAAAVMMTNRGDDPFAPCRDTAVAGEAAIGGPFTLIDETGQTVTEADVIDRPALIYFGYTSCPDICPLHAARTADAVRRLEDKGLEVKPVFISVDPARDTPEALDVFTDNLHPNMLGLTGSVAQIDAAVKAYRSYYNIPEPEDEYYTVDHLGLTYLMLPDHGFATFFAGNTTSEAMAETTACFVRRAASR